MKHFLIKTLMVTGLVGVLSACQSFAISTPYKSLIQIDPETPLTVVVTEAVVRDDRMSREGFDNNLDNVVANLDKQSGLVGYALRKELLGNKAWTITVWEQEQAIASFRTSSSHLPAMQNAPQFLSSASFSRLNLTAEELPLSWEKALQSLEEQGRQYQFINTKL